MPSVHTHAGDHILSPCTKKNYVTTSVSWGREFGCLYFLLGHVTVSMLLNDTAFGPRSINSTIAVCSGFSPVAAEKIAGRREFRIDGC